jgi:hypothetical protein
MHLVVTRGGEGGSIAIEVEMLSLAERSNGYSPDGGWWLDNRVRLGGEYILQGGGSYSLEAARKKSIFSQLSGAIETATTSPPDQPFSIDLKMVSVPAQGPLVMAQPPPVVGATEPDDVVIVLDPDRGDPDCLRLDGNVLEWRVFWPTRFDRRWREDLRTGVATVDTRPIDPCDVLSASPLVAQDHADGAVVTLHPDGTRDRVLVPAQPSGTRCRDSAVVRDGVLYYSNLCARAPDDGIWAIDVATGARKQLTTRGGFELAVTKDLVLWTENNSRPSQIGGPPPDVVALPRRGGAPRSLTSDAERSSSRGFGSLHASDAFAFWLDGGGAHRASLRAGTGAPLTDAAGAKRIVAVEGTSLLWLNDAGLHATDIGGDRRVGDWVLQINRRATHQEVAVGDIWIAWEDPTRHIRARRRTRATDK